MQRHARLREEDGIIFLHVGCIDSRPGIGRFRLDLGTPVERFIPVSLLLDDLQMLVLGFHQMLSLNAQSPRTVAKLVVTVSLPLFRRSKCRRCGGWPLGNIGEQRVTGV